MQPCGFLPPRLPACDLRAGVCNTAVSGITPRCVPYCSDDLLFVPNHPDMAGQRATPPSSVISPDSGAGGVQSGGSHSGFLGDCRQLGLGLFPRLLLCWGTRQGPSGHVSDKTVEVPDYLGPPRYQVTGSKRNDGIVVACGGSCTASKVGTSGSRWTGRWADLWLVYRAFPACLRQGPQPSCYSIHCLLRMELLKWPTAPWRVGHV